MLGLGLFVLLTAVSADRLATRALEREREQLAALVARDVASQLGRLSAPPILLDRALEDELAELQVFYLGFWNVRVIHRAGRLRPLRLDGAR